MWTRMAPTKPRHEAGGPVPVAPPTAPPSDAARRPPLDAGSTPLIRRLLSHIVSEGLPEGAHLAEQTLADALQVSRTPVRKALVDLSREGIVENIPRRGYFLARPARSL